MCNKEKHPHDEVIRAYLDGKTIEMFLEITRVWKELEPCSPAKRVVFAPYLKYRIKPEAAMYRVAMFKDSHGVYFCLAETSCEDFTNAAGFVRWVTDWVEVEV